MRVSVHIEPTEWQFIQQIYFVKSIVIVLVASLLFCLCVLTRCIEPKIMIWGINSHGVFPSLSDMEYKFLF